MLPPLLHGVRRQEVPDSTYLAKYTASLMSQIVGDMYHFSTNILTIQHILYVPFQHKYPHHTAHSINDRGPQYTARFHSTLRRCALHAGGRGREGIVTIPLARDDLKADRYM